MTFKTCLVLLILSIAAAAAAQERRAFLSGSVSAANMQSTTDVALAGALGYRLNRVVSLGIETTVMPNVRSSFPTNRGNGSNASVVTNAGGRVALFTGAARIDIPMTSARMTPFLTAGGGAASVRRTADFTYLVVTQTPTEVITRTGVTRDPGETRSVTEGVSASSTPLALMLGGGTDILLTHSLGLEVDFRLFRLFGNDDQNVGRFGLGVRYVF
jgi:opacity protein-like surface antigen